MRDITRPLGAGFPAWPGDPPVEIERAASMAGGEPCDVSRISFGAHAGTHLDAPSHVLPGAGDLASIPLEALVGEALVVHVPGGGAVSVEALASRLPSGAGALRGGRLLVRTESAETLPALPSSFASLSPEAARHVASLGARVVGIDTPSVDAPGASSLPSHRILAASGVAILEWLDLRGVPEGRYHLVALPLRLTDAEASPVRAILFDLLDGG